MPPPMKLEHAIARQMAVLREERAWTQSEMAHRMRELGTSWTASRVTQLETYRGKVSLYEVVALSWLFEVPVTRLLEGDDEIEFPNGEGQVPLDFIRRALNGQAPVMIGKRAVRGTASVGVSAHATAKGVTSSQGPAVGSSRIENEETRKIAKGLGISTAVLNYVSRQLWDRSFTVEREERLGDVSDLSKRSIQAKRGHATRALTAEVAAYLEKVGPEEVEKAYRRWDAARREQLLGQLESMSGPALGRMRKQIDDTLASIALDENAVAALMPGVKDVFDRINQQLGAQAMETLRPVMEQINQLGVAALANVDAQLSESVQKMFSQPELAARLAQIEAAKTAKEEEAAAEDDDA